MVKPLRSDEYTQPVDRQFTQFGLMNAGAQSRTSLATSVGINVVLAVIAIILGAAAKVSIEHERKIAELTLPITQPKPVPPPPPPLVIKLPKPPVLKPVEPKIVLPEVKIPDPPKTQPVEKVEKPLPAVKPAPPKVVIAAAAPRPTTVNLGQSASVVNNSQHPSPVALGRADNPIAPSNAPATAAVNLGQRGLAGMPAGNTGAGPASQRVNLGSGQPGGSLNGGGARAVQGVKLGGITNGTGTTPGNGLGSRPQTVQLGQATTPAMPRPSAETTKPIAHSGPQVLFKPRPVYTAEATALHLEGVVSVRIHVAASGAVQVLGVTDGLGHGLDQSAERAVAGTRFKPATDAQGNPIDWDGVVKVTFQIAS